MSQALFEQVANGRHLARSAGTRPADHLDLAVVEAMREVGIDVSGQRPQQLTTDLAQWADLVVTMGCGDECPYIPGKKYVDWDLEDAAGKTLAEVRTIREDIRRRVDQLARDLA